MTVSLNRAARGTFAALAALALLGPGAVAAHAATSSVAPPAAGQITVEVLTVNGSGCAPGTASVVVNSDNTAFRVKYDDYLAEAGGSTSPTDFRKACQLVLHVHIPQGFTYAIAEAQNRGKIQLKAGADGLLRTTYYFMGDSETEYVDHTFAGPRHGSWATTDIAPVAALVYAPCGADRYVNVKTELRVHADASNAYASMSMGVTKGSFDTLYQFSWKTC